MNEGQQDASSPEGMPRAEVDYRALFEAAPGLYLVIDPQFRIVAASDAYLRATMIDRASVLGKGIFEVFPDNPDDPEVTGVRNLRASLNRALRDKVSDAMAVQKYDIRRPESEGGGFEERFWSPVNTPVLTAAGNVAWIIHRVEDVTEFVRVRRHGIEQEELTQALRTRGEQMEAEILRRAAQLQDANERLRDLNAGLEQRVRDRTAELASANEQLRTEIGESKRLADQIRQRQKMEAIGTLAGGVAHDFNNLLTVIAGYSDVLLDTIPKTDAAYPLIQEISAAGNRAAALTRQLLAFSRQQVLEPRVLDVNAIVSDTERMLRRLIGEDVVLSTALAPDLGRVLADPSQLEQIIVNLVVNAREAMPQGGRLTIETANVDLDAGYAQSHMDVDPGAYVMLAVSDTGRGMDSATRARIFEPFFTTKERGKGTGMGLATVFGIVKQSRGHIWVYSEPDRGSTFKIYLPLMNEPLSTVTPGPSTPAPVGSDTILVVEDEDAVRGVTVFVLKSFGYTVLEANGGRDALRVCDTHDGPIHLLISDVIMPEMGGREVADAVLARRPGTKVLYLSGYTDDAVVRHGILHEEVAFLQKPFTPQSLGRKVREVLEG